MNPINPDQRDGNARALFFSRGRGRGHVFPDIAIADEIARITPGLDISFSSYATGAETFRSLGRNVWDLELPEANPFVTTLMRAGRLIRELSPDIVIAHEEFAALVAANISNVPSIFTGAWFPKLGSVSAESLACSDSVIIRGEAGIFAPPPDLSRKPIYVGPVIRRMSCTANDRPRLRRELEIGPSVFVMTVVQGGWATEARAPIAATVIAAFRQLEFENKKCFWLAGSDHELIMDLTKSQGGFEVCRFYDDVERLYAASDVIVTKGTYGATIEAASLGVHSVSISHASNPVDEILVPRIRSNIALSASATDGDVLADRLRSLVSLQKGPEPLLIHESGASKAALAIVLETERILGRNLGRMQVG
jgi:hypothetical protein